MCTVLLPPGDNPIAVNKYIISYHMVWNERMIGEGTDVPGRTEVNHADTQSTLSGLWTKTVVCDCLNMNRECQSVYCDV